MENKYVTVFESFKLSPPDIDVEIQHSFNGLVQGTILQSQVTNKSGRLLLALYTSKLKARESLKMKKSFFNALLSDQRKILKFSKKKLKRTKAKAFILIK